jgi:hypothetical protein
MSQHAIDNARGWLSIIQEHVTALEAAEPGTDEHEAARQTIEDSVLSVQVRDGWRSCGQRHEAEAEEYEILLTTGGPALRIWGELDCYQPDEWPKLQWQDWGTPWTDYPLGEERDAVTAFARVFYFDEG